MEIRPPTIDELPGLRDLERRAGVIFAEVGLDIVAADEPPPVEHLATHLAAGTIWVAIVDGAVAAYATASEVDGEGHLDQVSVDPAFARRGIGLALIEHVCTWAAAAGLASVTLTTYRDVPWNGPLYERYGFAAVPDDELGPELRAIRQMEAGNGLAIQPRIAMRRLISEGARGARRETAPPGRS